jgi:hypothetical protein
MSKQSEQLTTEHELYISVSLEASAAMKTETFKNIVDELIFENIGYVQSWGVHTKDEYIGIIDKQFEEIQRLKILLEWVYAYRRLLPTGVIDAINKEITKERNVE